MEYKIKVLRPHRGLHEGDILMYNKENNLFELREVDEVISDNYQSKNTRMVGFSPDFVDRFLDQLFEDVDGFFNKSEPEEAFERVEEEEDFKYKVDVSRLPELIDVVEKMRKELEELKTKTKPKKAKKQ